MIPHWVTLVVHLVITSIGFGLLSWLTIVDVIYHHNAFSPSGFGMAVGAIVGGSGLAAGGFMYGAQSFLGSGAGRITEG